MASPIFDFPFNFSYQISTKIADIRDSKPIPAYSPPGSYCQILVCLFPVMTTMFFLRTTLARNPSGSNTLLCHCCYINFLATCFSNVYPSLTPMKPCNTRPKRKIPTTQSGLVHVNAAFTCASNFFFFFSLIGDDELSTFCLCYEGLSWVMGYGIIYRAFSTSSSLTVEPVWCC